MFRCCLGRIVSLLIGGVRCVEEGCGKDGCKLGEDRRDMEKGIYLGCDRFLL